MNKIILIVITVLFVSLSLHAKELKEIALQLQWKHQFQFAGYYIAKEKGFYENEGLNVDIKEFEYGMSVVEEVCSKNITFGIGRPTLLMHQSEHQDLALLAAIFQSSPNILIAKEESKINSIEDFKNKRIMVTGDAREDALVLAMIRSNQISLKDLEVLEHSFDVEDLINNKTDLLSAYISNEPFLLKERGVKTKIFDPKNYGFDFYNDILFTKEENLYKNYKDVKHFTLASLKGWEYAFNNIEETVNLILDKYNTQGKSKEALLYEAKELKKLAYHKTDQIGKIDKAKVKTIYDYYKLMGFTDKYLDVENFVFNFFDSKYYLNKKEKKYLKKKKKITMCIDPSWMPFEAFDVNGKHTGMTKDYFDLFKDVLNTDIEVIQTDTWSKSIEFAKQRKCDIFSLAIETDERKKYMNFTTPYIESPLVIVTKQTVPFINNLKNVNSIQVGIPKGYAFFELMQEKYPNVELVEVASEDDGLRKVHNGELFGYIGVLVSIGYKIQNDYLGDLKVAGKLNESVEFSVGVRNDDGVLQDIIQKAINNLTDIQKKDISSKWISLKYVNGTDYTLLYQVLIMFGVILIIIFYFYRKLHQINIKLQASYLKIEKLAVTDKLTGLYNRHKVDEILEHEKQHSDRYDTSFGIIILDIDHFKKVNDTYGHNVGDIVLKTFAKTLMENTREVDIVGRWGGEEFMVIVHHTNKESIVKIAETLRRKIENTKHDTVTQVTASFGVTIHKRQELLDDTILRSDQALYASKENGRNRITYK